MKKQITTHQKKSEEHGVHSLSQANEGERVFESTEEMLKFDAAQHPVPPRVGERLVESVKREPPPAGESPWWRRLFG